MTNIKLINSMYRSCGEGAGAAGSLPLFFTTLAKDITREDSYVLLHNSYQCRMFLVDNVYEERESRLPPKSALNTLYFLHGREDTITNIINNLPLLNKFEEEAGISLTKLIPYDEAGIIVEGDLEWSKTLWKISLYSFLLKTLAYPKGVPTGGGNQETTYYREFIINKKLFCKNIKNNKELTSSNYDFYAKSTIIWSSHSTPGFYSICIGLNPPQREVLEQFAKGEEKC